MFGFCRQGKEVFIKSILQAIPVYAIQCFLFPKVVCDKLEDILNKLWWANNRTLKGIHWSSSATLCLVKALEHLGFRELSKFYIALLAKECWRILFHPNCLLAKILKARYFSHSNFMSASLGSYPSLTWRSIWSAQGLIEGGMGWRVGTRSHINIWNDPQLPLLGPTRVACEQIDIRFSPLNQLIDTKSHTQNEARIQQILKLDDVYRVLTIPVAQSLLQMLQYGGMKDQGSTQ